ncbi:MAG: carboxypeptidase-like regulatory domain-containing protein [Gemmatimonadota bacterium]|nr:carboxypeptidase-like regulatory domain-containing protein [Gemmatimonadota bacterium]
MTTCSILLIPAALLALVTTRSAEGQGNAPAPTGVVMGTVLDSLTGAPIADAAVQLVPADTEEFSRAYAAFSDTSGRYRLEGVRNGRYVIGCGAPARGDDRGDGGEGRPGLFERELGVRAAPPGAGGGRIFHHPR